MFPYTVLLTIPDLGV